MHLDKPSSTAKQDSGLLLIGLFKLSKAILFASIGAGALHFLHHDLGDWLQRLVAALHFDPENHLISIVLDRADDLSQHRLRQISLGTFAYSALALTEGTGLMLKKVWAEYLTLWLSVSFLPWEFYELVRHPDLWRTLILLVNTVVVMYLVWLLRRKRQSRELAEAAEAQ